MPDNVVKDILTRNSGIKLDIGCGENKQDGFVGIDMTPHAKVDIVHDLEEFPWPLPDESVVLATSSHVVEHISPHKGVFIRFMNEVWRVLKPDCQFAIATPHGRSPGYIQDPTHCNPCNENTWLYFDPLEQKSNGQLYGFYRPKPWQIEELFWDPFGSMEIVLRKRRIDPSYGHDPEVWNND
jgi:SAM-dependent methyltransferase